jgi:hypothetical protein
MSGSRKTPGLRAEQLQRFVSQQEGALSVGERSLGIAIATVPVGTGLFAFDTLEQAVAAIETIEGDPRSHAAAACEVAVDQFDSDKVLACMLDDIFATSGGRL